MGPQMLAVSAIATVLWVVLALILGAGAALAAIRYLGKAKRQAARQAADQLVDDARKEAERLLQKADVDAKAEFIKKREEFDKETAQVRNELREIEKRLDKREDNLEKKLDTLATKERNLEKSEGSLAAREKAVTDNEQRAQELVEEQRRQLLRISGLRADEAKDLLLRNIENEVRQEASALIERVVSTAQEEAESRARDITVTAIQRYAAEHTTDSTVSTVDIPSDDMKGRVIGREGRNIRAFEKATGIDVVVDDTPGVVVVSGFDPVRREVARLSLEKLIQDGRIHPARIEEVVGETREEVDRRILDIGKKASMEANVPGLHKRLVELLGRLNYRTSYGQNVLRHSIEVTYLCQVMAEELGLDGALARRCGLLHDIGKAIDHEVEGSHPEIGAELVKKLGEKPEVVNAVLAHHGDQPPISVYTPLVSAADAISASRPGSRRESLERYIKRLEELEGIATGFDGVKQAYAIQAGREVRVIVDADRVNDDGSFKMARDIAKQIQEQMTYPGEVRVTLLREVRAIEYAR